jgi:hypothetical protein
MPPCFKKIDCHMVFDVKLDLVRIARFVAGGHQTDPPKESVNSSVVFRDSVHLAFLIAALNDLEVLSADVQNAYLNASMKERIYTIAGPEFGQGKEGRLVMMVRALYGLRSSGTRWHDHLAVTLLEAGFKACKAAADVWMRPAVKADGFKYYEYVLCDVDDLLVVSEHPKRIMEGLEAKYVLKVGSVGEPKTYLGQKSRSTNWSTLTTHARIGGACRQKTTSIEQSRMWRRNWRKSARCCRPRSQLPRRRITVLSWIRAGRWGRSKPRTLPV